MTEVKADAPAESDFPKWLTEDFFKDVIRAQYGTKDYEVTDLKLSYAVGKGENYVSTMFRAVLDLIVNGKAQEFHTIVKAFPESNLELPKEMIEMLNPFPKETKSYKHFIPEFQKLFKEKGVDVEFAPKCHKSVNEPTDIIVMDDLKAQGYKVCNRKVGLDLDHAKVLLKKLSQFHAASAAYVTKYGQFEEPYREGVFKESSRAIFESFKGVTRTFYKIARTWPFGAKYIDVMEKANHIDTFMDIILETTKVDENAFNVLNHGDMWVNNFMFCYDEEEKIKDVRIIDYQISFYGSPVLDLHKFFISSLKQDIRIKEISNLLRFYYDNLVENLEILEYDKPIPTMKELHLDFVNREFYGDLKFKFLM